MDDLEEFLAWFNTTWRHAEVALHDGDAEPRFRTWSDRAPVTLFGAWMNATDPSQAREVFRKLAHTFNGTVSTEVELIAADVSGTLAYTVHREHTEAVVNDQPRRYTLRVTQVYRREDDGWKVVHRHGDEEPDPTKAP